MCVHHDAATVLSGGCCKAGVRYLDIGTTIKERPCFNGHFLPDPAQICPKWERMTNEQALHEIRNERKRIMEFIARINAKEGETSS
jgi:hypothetical protein